MLTKIFQIILLLSLAATHYTALASDNNGAAELAQQYIASVQKNGFEIATKNALNTNTFNKPDKKERIRRQKLIQNLRNLGDNIGFDFIGKEKLGVTVEIHRYILKTEQYPLLLSLYLYQPKENWIIANIQISDLANNDGGGGSGVPMFSVFSIF